MPHLGHICAHQDSDTEGSICICEIPSDLVLRCVEQREGERPDENGGLKVGYPRCDDGNVCSANTAGALDHGLDVLRSFANQTLPSTLIGVAIFLGMRTWGGK